MRDPRPYDGPLRRIDGKAPFNHHLWAFDRDWYWPNRHCNRGLNSRFNFGAVALADGRWLAGGCAAVHGDPTCYPDRTSALRASAAAMLRTARNARRWSAPFGLSEAEFGQILAWTRAVIADPRPAVEMETDPLYVPSAAAPPGEARAPAAVPAVEDLPLFRASSA